MCAYTAEPQHPPEVTSSLILPAAWSFCIPPTSFTVPIGYCWRCWPRLIPVIRSKYGCPTIWSTRLRRWHCARSYALEASAFGTSDCQSCVARTGLPAGWSDCSLAPVRLVRGLRATRPHLVYCTTSAALLGAPAARLARVPRVVGHFQEVWSRADSHVLAGAARACHTLVAISESVTDALPQDLRRRTIVVANGTPEPHQVIPLTGRSGDLHFLMASRWTPTKGYRTLLDAWDRAGAPGTLDHSRRYATQRRFDRRAQARIGPPSASKRTGGG